MICTEESYDDDAVPVVRGGWIALLVCKEVEEVA